MTNGVATAGGGHAWETALVAELSHGGAPFAVVRRCADMADVLAVASTGQIVVAAVAADLRRLDSETIVELTAFGVPVVCVYRAGDGRLPGRLERIGVAASVPDDAPPAALIAALRAAASGERPAGLSAPVGADPGRTAEVRQRPAVGAPPAPDQALTTDTAQRAALHQGRSPGSEPLDNTALSAAGTVDRPDPRRRRRRTARRSAHRADRTGAARPISGSDHAAPVRDRSVRRGRVVAVWGPVGAPGRSTVAMGLADRAVAAGADTVLIDADVYGGVLANALGLLDESAGLAGACRLASSGRLDAEEFARLCWQVREGLVVLTGISRADRWPEVRPSAIPAVLEHARARADVVVVDCSAIVETDEEITFDTLAPRRNGATVAVLAAADVVIAVGAADPPGMERLARGLAEVTATVDGVEPRVVFNRVRPSAATRQELRDASRRYCGRDPIGYLPDDQASMDLAWRRGVTLSLAAAKSPLISAFDELAAVALGAPVR
jgi:MinD-like ATPase involved in chromosome partitioning or flagellar assembly